VVHGVVAHQMTTRGQLAQKIAPRQILGSIAHDVVAIDEEHRFDPATGQLIENQRGSQQIRTVVEGQ